MVQQLLTYAKGVEGEKICVLPGHLIKEMESIISRTFPANIEVVTDYSEDLNAIHGEATQIHQVLLNLCVNARDAMPEGGSIQIDISQRVIEANNARVFEVEPGEFIEIVVSDTGVGMNLEETKRAFEPFYTNKQNRK